MPTIHVQAGSAAHLQEIADSLWKAKKVVVVTGAGISTNSGIPDFRSENGLYSMIQSQFDAAARLDGSKNRANGVSSDDSGDELRPKKRRKTSLVGDTIEVGVPNLDREPTVEGDSIKVLSPDDSQISDASEGGNPGDPAHKDDARPSEGTDPEHERRDPGEEEVDLLTEKSVLARESTPLERDAQENSQHESNGRGLCSKDADNNREDKKPVAETLPTDGRHEEEEKDGANDTAQPIATDGAKDQCRQGGTQTAPSSPEPDRGVEQEKGKRALGVGKLRPDIVLYGEEHPESQRISDIIQHDLSLAPDLLIIMGTSLKVHGLKTVVKEFAKAIHNKKDGKVIFVNYTKPADSVWADTIDFWVEMDCDAWVHDLKEKKPIIWSPPGTIDEESRSTKRRRRTNVDSEKAVAKRDSQGEGADETPVSELKTMAKKAEKKCSQAATKPCPVPKPAPKRPVSEREHKDNGAYWTTRIMANLALISGREVKKYSTLSTTPASARKPLGAGQAVSKPAEPVAPKQALRKGRGPRLKNARTRKPVPAVATSEGDAVGSNAVQDLASRQTGHAEDQKPGAGSLCAERPDHQKRVTSSGEPPASVVTMEPKADPDVKVADKVSSQGSGDDTSPTAQVGQEASVVDSRGSPDSMVESNSILAAVKSHHRIRKPKAIFEPKPMSFSKSGRGTPASSAGNAKSRAKPASQARKGRGSGKVVKTEPATATRVEKSAILPPPIPVRRPVSQSNTGKPTESRRHGTPDEAYRLAPLHPENLESYKYQGQHSDRPYPLAKPLEPISKNFEGPCRGLDFVGMTPAAQPDGQAAMTGTPSAPPPPSQLATQLAMITAPPSYSSSAFASAPVMLPQNPRTVDSQLPPHAQSVHDSPSRQLHQEEALEAAAALSQLRSPPIFDERRFRI
ncbi:hypothetical protein INS49_000159 [Diaporthe citri]|uniref:uncharacterized protein n=1 Tax=Diaporthe citri TaxID=83186 RepID=UPI001C7E90FC|nr:uncharacterized protein INS49_000159 [Diaporthe citri]KAG6365983.1 hypothetical protein INS49_000159 [Diaporthe citri]